MEQYVKAGALQTLKIGRSSAHGTNSVLGALSAPEIVRHGVRGTVKIGRANARGRDSVMGVLHALGPKNIQHRSETFRQRGQFLRSGTHNLNLS